jgi:polar amino acid transport system substrate-binding protein
MYRIPLALLALALLLAAQGCAARAEARAAAEAAALPPPDMDVGQSLYEPAVLRVGVSAGKPPLVFQDGDTWSGLEPELARALAAEFGAEVEFVALSREDQIPALVQRRVDILMSGLAVTDDRRKLVQFCRPYLRVGFMALVRREDRRLYRTENDVRFTELRVATEEATTTDLFVQERMRFCQHFHVDSLEVGADALLTGQVDLLIGEGPAILWLADRYVNSGLTPLPHQFHAQQLAWAVHPEDLPLWHEVNIALGRMGADGRLNAAMDRWLPRRR